MKPHRKLSVIWRFLRGVSPLFLLSLLCSMFNTLFTALTPQIIRAAVDSVIGAEPFDGLPAALAGRLSGLPFREALLWSAGAVLAVGAMLLGKWL